MYQLNDLLKVAKRENNFKRRYLYVNPLQGKHIPVSPSMSLELFSELAKKIDDRYSDERVLIVGFAETATAIGSALAYESNAAKYYINTTREEIPGAEYLFFTESHSHATEQRLVTNELGNIINNVDRVVFAEDEVTTGTTIEKLKCLLQEKYKNQELKYGIISILNSMSEERQEELYKTGVEIDYLYKVPFLYHIDDILKYSYQLAQNVSENQQQTSAETIQLSDYWNCRMISDAETIRERTARFVTAAKEYLGNIESINSILILGTEEFMFPGMALGNEIEKQWPEKRVRFHATTRSPIAISQNRDYPLHSRRNLISMYDKSRSIYIYNLDKYEKVFIVTDANPVCSEGLSSLVNSLKNSGNEDIALIQWRD